VPGLSESIYSFFLHLQTPHHELDSSYEKGLFLQFPKFKTKAIIGTTDIYLDMVPLDTNNPGHQTSSNTSHLGTSQFCCNITQLKLIFRMKLDI
jgi:hypothetical protein